MCVEIKDIASYLVTKPCVPQDGPEKTFIRHNDVLYVIQVLSQKDPFLLLRIGQVVSKFLADDEPLASCIHVSVVLFLRNNRQSVDAMEPVVTLHKIIPDGFGGSRGFKDDVHEISIDGIICQRVSDSLIAYNRVGSAGHVNKMREMYVFAIYVIQNLTHRPCS